MLKSFIILLCGFTFIFAKESVVVSIAPQKFFVQKVAGDRVDVTILVPTGSSPATYAPKPKQLQILKKSKLYFTIGVAFEKHWLKRFQSINSNLKIVDTTKGIQKIAIAHEGDKNHHEGLDPHVWLSPRLVKLQVENITKALISLDPKNRIKYISNRDKFLDEIDELDIQISKTLSTLKKRDFIVFHPSFGYFAKDYNLKQIAIEKEGKEPSLKHIKKVIDYASKHNIQTIFVAPQFSKKSASYIASQVDANIKTINPLAENWTENIVEITKSFKSAN